MLVNSVSGLYSFKGVSTNNNDTNPISKSGEKAKLTKATFIAGLGLGAKLLFEYMDDFVFDTLGDKAKQLTQEQCKNASSNKRIFLRLGAWAGLIVMFIGAVAALYTLFKAPKINYDGNVNAFQKGKDMDVYIKGNNAEREIYTQMNEKAKNADEAEKEKLREQYMKLQMAKNKVPDFVDIK